MRRGWKGALALILILLGCSGRPPADLGIREGRLAPCPGSPNCISTQDTDASRRMDPLPFIGTAKESRERILGIVRGMERAEIVEATDTYIHVSFTSRIFRFVDDVEFRLDETARVVHFRSASRVGYYDFGVNRRRMRKIAEGYRKR